MQISEGSIGERQTGLHGKNKNHEDRSNSRTNELGINNSGIKPTIRF